MIRKAKIQDAKDIYKLISFFSEKGLMLPRSLNSIYENIRDFWVITDNGLEKIVGSVALHVVGWDNLAEVKSLSIDKDYHKSGLGKQLVEKCIDEAKTLGIKKVFALTFTPDFFSKCGFKQIDKETLPHKIWADCIDCPYFPDCKEIAFLKQLP
jgi:amino-acid N-acetyltransferase